MCIWLIFIGSGTLEIWLQQHNELGIAAPRRSHLLQVVADTLYGDCSCEEVNWSSATLTQSKNQQDITYLKWACDELEREGGGGDLMSLFHGRRKMDLLGSDTLFRDTFAETISSFESEATAKELFGSDDFFFCILEEGIKQLSKLSLAPANLAKIHPFAFLKLELPKILANFEAPRRPEHALAFAMVWRLISSWSRPGESTH